MCKIYLKKILNQRLAFIPLLASFFLPSYAQGASLAVDWQEREAMMVGRGFDSATNQALGDCMDLTTPPTAEGSQGPTKDFVLQMVDNYESLTSELGITVSAAAQALLFSVSGKANFVNNFRFTSTSTHVLARATVLNPQKSVASPKYRPEILTLLKANKNNLANFQRICGDTFINGYTSGAELFAIISFESKSLDEKKEVDALIQANQGAFKSTVEFQNHLSRLTSNIRSEISIFQRGGLPQDPSTPFDNGDNPSLIPTDLKTVLLRIENLPAIAAKNPVPLRALLFKHKDMLAFTEATGNSTMIQIVADVLIKSISDLTLAEHLKLSQVNSYLSGGARSKLTAPQKQSMYVARAKIINNLNKLRTEFSKCLASVQIGTLQCSNQNIGLEIVELPKI